MRRRGIALGEIPAPPVGRVGPDVARLDQAINVDASDFGAHLTAAIAALGLTVKEASRGFEGLGVAIARASESFDDLIEVTAFGDSERKFISRGSRKEA